MRLRWFLVILSAAFPLLVGFISVQSAAASPVVHTAAASPDVPLNAPAGCPRGDVCFYYKGNGGNLCGYTDANSSNLVGLAPNHKDCNNIGPSGSIYNNGNSCSGCQDVNLYYLTGYGGAWYCLPKGHYLLYIEQNHFIRGVGLAGYKEILAYQPNTPPPNGPGGVASVKWTSC
jgi:hypothetical protein